MKACGMHDCIYKYALAADGNRHKRQQQNISTICTEECQKYMRRNSVTSVHNYTHTMPHMQYLSVNLTTGESLQILSILCSIKRQVLFRITNECYQNTGIKMYVLHCLKQLASM